ncbi:electron transport complex subunit RsxC [Aeromonas hydrophila]|uniref:electron transport complex subunit RsxC n=2 Tax=Aeromonas hydrophila TaxID=644 RepID=UPI000332B474|nr:electron transport complex subunit RsxC [Aeromonas hydrophila]AGM44567.1 RnfABCDGE type electron transport complex subunit C [Aeromonas hydrophila ML09-119]AHX33233.1 electron transporter RnfC [Aeromonas hydrophila subsp. hydrophila AL09-71]AHX70033.1 electron transporter RnfC [Aeromonas hydrophila pc104A]AJE35941.1 electron transporter RnfC [Aeromonas hydrophila J-1]AKJ34143.1 electron transporter RnfC [Aeromonas hydrophila NJ-35]
MQSLLERIKAGTLWDFHGGIHPPENKDQSSLTPVVDAGLPPQLIIPVRQHAGPAGDLLVRVGDQVKKGQPLTRHDKGRFVPVHASTSGTITAIGHHTVAHPSGLDDLCITLTPDGEDAWGERQGRSDYWNLERGELLERIQQAGIAGLGGAVFPTHSKLDGRGQLTEILIVNGLECEPYITTDDRLMQEYADEIMDGIRVLKHLLKPRLTLIGVEDNKPAAIGELTRHATDEDVLVKTVPTKYPSGGAKQTIELLTGRQVPKGGRAVDMGIMVLNVATVFAIKRAIIDGEPLISRIVTLTGDAFKKPGNAWVLLGTPVRWLLQRFELQPEADQRVIMGGPMMGFTLPHAMVPVVKATNCLLSPTRAELPPPGPEQACIRCSACADACPANLLPQELYWYSRAKEYDKAEGLNLFDCIECGACAWVCPSEIPLVQYYKIAKDDIREARAEAEKAERAKQRFEAKQARFEREKAAREARHAEAAAQRRQAMTAAGGEDPVAAALARIKAKQDAAPVGASELAPDNSAMIAAREARKQEAIARRAAKAAASEPDSAQADAPATDGQDAKKAAIAAALARAKAKKAAQEPGEAAAVDSPAAAPQPNSAADTDPKKAAIAAAIARAKAKKAAQAQGDAAVTEGEEAAVTAPATAPQPDSAADADPKKAAIAAAIARAKAKKAAQAQGYTAVAEGEEAAVAAPAAAPQPDSAADADPKKAAIAAAIARAKAKKAAQAQGDAAVTEGDEAAVAAPAAAPQPDTADADPKKAAIAAAIARAKAKKAAQAQGEEAVAKPAEAQDEEATAKPEVTTLAAPATDASQPAADADPKKAAIAAAVARAKARKLAAEAAAQASPSPSTDKSH